MPQVRLIDENGGQVGIQSTEDALKYAWDKNLDLVEVAPDARPPVCRVMDYRNTAKQEQKAKLARKPIDDHDQEISAAEDRPGRLRDETRARHPFLRTARR